MAGSVACPEERERVNVVIVGCGNVGFELAKSLAGTHRLLLVDRARPPHLDELAHRSDVTFCVWNVLDPSGAAGLALATTQAFSGEPVDVMVCTVGTLGTAPPADDFARFRAELELNLLGPLACAQHFGPAMVARGAGRLVLVTSTSGHHAAGDLTAYAPSKWALEAATGALRQELARRGVQVDAVAPFNIQNRYSEVFAFDFGVPPEVVATSIARRFTATRAAPRSFVPKRYEALHVVERLGPRLLDLRAGLAPFRSARHRARRVENVVVGGADLPLGLALARAYDTDPRTRSLTLIGSDRERLAVAARDLRSEVRVEVVADIDAGSFAALPARLGPIDMVVVATGAGPDRDVLATSPDDYRTSLARNLYAPVLLTSAFHRAGVAKIVHVMDPAAIQPSAGASSSAAPLAALWAWTRALRRLAKDTQVLEVLAGSERLDDVARAVLTAERRGHEVLLYPRTLALRLVREAIVPA